MLQMRFTFQLYSGMQAMRLAFSSYTKESRCTARLLIRELDSPSSLVSGCVDETCKLFEGG